VYTLTFTFDGKKYSTNFIFSTTGFTNGCIIIDYGEDDYITSKIESNSDTKKCFNPMLKSKHGLPEGVSQTDILQVLMTKLKFILLDFPETSSLINAAVLSNPETGKLYSTPFSLWKLLRGEKSLYGKYGYSSDPFFWISNHATRKTWGEIKDNEVAVYGLRKNGTTNKTIEDIWNEFYSDKGPIKDTETVADVMKRLTYEDTEKSVKYGESIVHAIIDSFRIKGTKSRTFRLSIRQDSEIWQGWNERLKIVSFEKVTEGGTRNKTRRHRKRIRKTRKN
jgi:hypothetical protein